MTDSVRTVRAYSYAGTMGLLQGESMDRRFFHRLGASDRTICASAGGEALAATYGGKIGMHLEHVVDSRLILIWGSNSIASNLHFWTLAQAAKRQGAKLVCIDPRRTETADKCHEHIALMPGTDGALTQLEHLDVHTSYGHTYALLNEPAIASLGKALPNTAVFRELARRIGFDEPCFGDSDEDMARVGFSRDVSFDALREQGWVKLPLPEAPLAEGGFRTPSGKCLIDSPQYGVPDHVPNHECAVSTSELAARYPLAMISPPARNFLNSTFVNVQSLRDIEGEPVVEIHPADAAPRGIHDGDKVHVFNDRGSTQCKALVGERARPGVVNGLGIWWRKLGADGTNVNEVTHQRLADIGRAPSFYDCLVDVRRAALAAL